jgi:hypothetical protein
MESAMEVRKEQMAKLIKIEDCAVCPHSTFSFGGLRCKLHDRWMDDRYYPEIPDWCTLHDAELTEEKHKKAFEKILKRTIENNSDLLKELAKL